MQAVEKIRMALALASLAAVPIGCAPAVQTDPRVFQQATSPRPEQLGTQRKSDVVTGSELRALGVNTAAEGLRRLRPEFLRPVPTALVWISPADRTPVVYVDDVFIGQLESLDFVPLDAVQEIRFLQPMKSVERWGPGCRCGAGVVHVITSRVGR